MNIQAVRIEESVDLETMSSKTCVVFRLPTGKYFRATVDDEEGMQYIVEAAAQGAKEWAPGTFHTDVPPPPLPVSGPVPVSVPTPADYETTEGDEKVIWRALPNDILSPLMKAAFTKLGVAPELTMQAVHNMMDSVTNSFTPDDWAVVRSDAPLEVQAEVQPVAVSQPAPTASVSTSKPSPSNTLPLGKVAWADGSPMLPGMGTPSRTVPSDEFGYPVTPGEADPGEAIGGSSSDDVDEDGVAQF